MSNEDALDQWQPSEFFNSKSKEDDGFLEEEAQDEGSEAFLPRSLIQVRKVVDSEMLNAKMEEEPEIQPLVPLDPEHDNPIDQPIIDVDAARQEAFAEGEAKGIEEGRRLAQEELADRQQQFEIDARDELRVFMSSIQEDLIQHNRLAEPLKRLAVSLAEHIARAELQLSDQSINNMIERVVSELEPSELQKVVVTVSPSWRNRIAENQFETLFEDYEIRVSETLSDGSIRLSTEDRSIEDLVEQRIAQIASQVFDLSFPEQDKSRASGKAGMSIEESADFSLEESMETSGQNNESSEASVVYENNETEDVVVPSNDDSHPALETPFVMEPPEQEDMMSSSTKSESDI